MFPKSSAGDEVSKAPRRLFPTFEQFVRLPLESCGDMGLRHQIAIRPKSGIAVRSEINLTPVQLDIPELAGSTKKRLWMVRHGEPAG
jgi:hypothetical protein